MKKLSTDDWRSLAIALGGPLAAGQIIGLACAPDVTGRWYTKLLKRPRWNPPNWLFGAVWPVLYTAQSVASWLVWKNKDGTSKKLPLGLYAAQLVLNLIWQPIMFKGHRVDVALADAAAMTGVAAAAAVTMTRAAGARNSKIAVASLMSPYVAWLTFATALTGKILQMNQNPKPQDLPRDEPVTQKAAKVADKVAGAVGAPAGPNKTKAV